MWIFPQEVEGLFSPATLTHHHEKPTLDLLKLLDQELRKLGNNRKESTKDLEGENKIKFPPQSGIVPDTLMVAHGIAKEIFLLPALSIETVVAFSTLLTYEVPG